MAGLSALSRLALLGGALALLTPFLLPRAASVPGLARVKEAAVALGEGLGQGLGLSWAGAKGGTAKKKKRKPKVYTKKQLAAYQGDSKVLLLAVLGKVFDVSKGRKYYGKGGGYSGFTGRDGSRAFQTGDFTDKGLTDDLEGMTYEHLAAVEGWRKFYVTSKKYKFRGWVAGRFYDSEGKPTEELKRVESAVAEYRTFEEQQKLEEQKYQRCNSNFTKEEGGYVWCPYHQLPRKLLTPVPGGGNKERCACFKESELYPDDQNQSDRMAFDIKGMMEIYDACSPNSRTCRHSHPTT